ncbi:hypothetical protein P4O66_017069 [Electrophorus voltai]|uniref:Uncharacterized protein n=1 Tax=Electrophorus voltai TaxID=2609070 RepID=A0AAD8YWL5_9TELE|nr:hypothetical protein P4O66_017069 [Electrophorus voltai]
MTDACCTHARAFPIVTMQKHHGGTSRLARLTSAGTQRGIDTKEHKHNPPGSGRGGGASAGLLRPHRGQADARPGIFAPSSAALVPCRAARLMSIGMSRVALVHAKERHCEDARAENDVGAGERAAAFWGYGLTLCPALPIRRGSTPLPIKHLLRREEAVSEDSDLTARFDEPGPSPISSSDTQEGAPPPQPLQQKYRGPLRIVLLGQNGVGKSSLALSTKQGCTRLALSIRAVPSLVGQMRGESRLAVRPIATSHGCHNGAHVGLFNLSPGWNEGYLRRVTIDDEDSSILVFDNWKQAQEYKQLLVYWPVSEEPRQLRLLASCSVQLLSFIAAARLDRFRPSPSDLEKGTSRPGSGERVTLPLTSCSSTPATRYRSRPGPALAWEAWCSHGDVYPGLTPPVKLRGGSEVTGWILSEGKRCVQERNGVLQLQRERSVCG